MKCFKCGRTIARLEDAYVSCRHTAGGVQDIFLCAECGAPRTCARCGAELGEDWRHGWGPGEYLCPSCEGVYLAAFRAAGEADAQRGREERPMKFFRRPPLYAL
jgi:hypothetical protein